MNFPWSSAHKAMKTNKFRKNATNIFAQKKLIIKLGESRNCHGERFRKTEKVIESLRRGKEKWPPQIVKIKWDESTSWNRFPARDILVGRVRVEMGGKSKAGVIERRTGSHDAPRFVTALLTLTRPEITHVTVARKEKLSTFHEKCGGTQIGLERGLSTGKQFFVVLGSGGAYGRSNQCPCVGPILSF